MHAQNHEDDVLLEHFADAPPGRLLDIGAYSPTTFSNSRALIDRGWSAVLVEPSPNPFVGLLDAYGRNPNVTLVNAAVAESAGLHAWYDSGGDAVSTLDESHRRKWEGHAKYSRMLVSTVTLAQLLAHIGTAWQFVNIDVEGQSARLLGEFPLEEMTGLKAVCVEHDNALDFLDSELCPLGFERRLTNAENAVYLR